MNDNKRIVFNSIILYTKLIINIVVSFVSSRVVLDALGASDYGLYNVVGGVVSMLNIIGSAMVATSYRFIAVELGKGKSGDPNKLYNTILIIHIAAALLLIVLGEVIGAYYVRNYLNIDSLRIPDALFVLRLSIITTSFVVISVPTNGLIIAREKFLFTATVESISLIVKLCLIFSLLNYSGNRLQLYAVYLAAVQFSIPLSYQIYCHLKERDIIKWKLNKVWEDYKKVISFAWWILVGAVAEIGKTQGAAVIINYFFGTLLNAAFGLATQVSHAVSMFSSTMSQAAVPQIMKSHSSGSEGRSTMLVYTISRYSFLCMLLMTIPIIFCLDDILILWLGEPPEYTKVFIIFMLINGLTSTLRAGFDASIQATGKIRLNQIGYSLINLLLLPIIFILYKMGLPPYINVIVTIFLTFASVVFQLFILHNITAFKINDYIKRTAVPCLITCIVAFIPFLLVRNILCATFSNFLVLGGIILVWTCIAIYLFGVTKTEKELVLSKLRINCIRNND